MEKKINLTSEAAGYLVLVRIEDNHVQLKNNAILFSMGVVKALIVNKRKYVNQFIKRLQQILQRLSPLLHSLTTNPSPF